MRRLDRLIVAAALVLVAVVAVDALRGHGGSSRSSQSSFPQPTSTTVATTKNSTQVQVVEQSSSLGEAPVPSLVRLIPSSTAFLPNCPTRTLALRVVPGPALQLHFMGSRCHVPPLHLHAVVRDSRGRVVYAGLALAHEGLSGNYAGEGVTRAPLVVGCRSTPLFATVTGSGLTADGPIRCRGDR